MSPRQLFAYYHFAAVNKNRDLAIQLNVNAMAAQAAGKDIREFAEKLMKD